MIFRLTTILLLSVFFAAAADNMQAVPAELCRIDRLSVFRKNIPAKADTHITLSRDNKNIYVSVNCREPLAVKCENRSDGYNVWQGDSIEVFFGGMGKRPWYRHFVVGAGGGRHSIYAKLQDWEAKVSSSPNSWKADLTIPLCLMGDWQDGMRFNILRERKDGREVQSWGSVTGAHDIESFNKIPFALPDDYAVHGPWLFQPGTTQIGIGWESAGTCVTVLEYRKKGTQKYRTAESAKENGIRPGDSAVHKVWLCGLEPDTEYEYRIKGVKGSFRTLKDKKADFSMFITSDLHDRPGHLKKILQQPDLQNCDFAVYLGDMLTSSLDKSVYYDGFLDASVQNWKKPIVFIRGNHEVRGRSAGVYFKLFGTGDNKGYFTFQHGGVLFIVLDLELGYSYGESGKLYRRQEADFLARVAKSPEFKNADFRVVLGHIPPLSPRLFGKTVVEALKVMPENSIDIFIGGHVHCCAYVPAKGKNVIATNPRLDGMPSYGLDFPVLAGDYGGIIKFERKGDELKIITLDSQGKEFKAGPAVFKKR